jgi:hypothetical protein
MILATPKKKGKHDQLSISKILSLCKDNKIYKSDVLNKLEKFQIPVIDQSLSFSNDWKTLTQKLEEYVYCIWIISASQGDPRDSLIVCQQEIENIEKLIKEQSERTVIVLSILAHSLRLDHWMMTDLVLKSIHHIDLLELEENLKMLVDQACIILSDLRVINIFSSISGLKPNEIQEILKEKRFRIRFVNIGIPVKGWITPVEIVLNLELLTPVEKSFPIAFARLLGHELAHYFCRLNSNFGYSTPEKLKKDKEKSSEFFDLVESIKEIHPQISMHIESGLIFELSFIGAKLRYSSENLCHILEQRFEDKSLDLPLIKINQESNLDFFKSFILEFNEQFGFCAADIYFDAM